MARYTMSMDWNYKKALPPSVTPKFDAIPVRALGCTTALTLGSPAGRRASQGQDRA